MDFKVLLVFLPFLGVTTAIQCQLMAMTECNQFEMVQENSFKAFIPKDQWTQYCDKMRIALECIYQPKYMDGCSPGDTFFYDMQRNVSEAVCGDGEYLKHVNCLGNEELGKQLSERCISFETEETCDHFKSIRACATHMILTKCGDVDSPYMDYLIYAYLDPYASFKQCEMDAPKFQIITTTTPAKTGTMDPTGKASTAAMGGSTTSGDPGSGSILQASSLLIATLTLAKCAIAIDNNGLWS